MAKKWTKASVDELMELAKGGSLSQIEGFFAENGYEKLPARDKRSGANRGQGGFYMTDLWDTLVQRHDVDVYRFFKTVGLPKPQYFKRFFDAEDCTFDALFHAYSSDVPEAEAGEIEGFLGALLEDGWRPRSDGGEPVHLAWTEWFLMGQMPASTELLESFAQTGFFDCLRKSSLHAKEGWDAVLRFGRTAPIPYLTTAEYRPKSVCLGANASMELVEELVSLGIGIEQVSSNCPHDVLMRCASMGVPPARDADASARKDIRGTEGEVRHDLGATLDDQAIEAFLAAGLIDGVDEQPAINAGRDDILEIIGKYADGGIPTKGLSSDGETLEDASYYLNEDGICVVPGGVKRIGSHVCSNFGARELHGLVLPESLEVIAPFAFDYEGHVHSSRYDVVLGYRNSAEIGTTVVVPKGVRSIGDCALLGFGTIFLYDSLEESDNLDSVSDDSTEYVVRSAKSDEVKYVVYVPAHGSERPMGSYNDFASAWGKGVGFDFPVLDKWYPKFKTPEAKLRTALNRLCWPIDLDEKTADKYRRYLCKNVEAVLELLRSDAITERPGLLFPALGKKSSDFAVTASQLGMVELAAIAMGSLNEN